MKTRHAALLVAMLGTAGCGGGSGKDAARVDQDYASAMEVGRDSFDLSHADQARSQFKTAYGRALLRDDLMAIRDAGYNLAVADQASGHAGKALATVARVHADMALRGDMASPALDLVAMAAYCRLGRYVEALETGRRIATRDPALSERLAFLTGLAADSLGDTARLRSAFDAMPASAHPPRLEQADRAELASRLLTRQGHFDEAEAQAQHAVDSRRDMLDYSGMARGLECAARAAQGAGETERAARYERRAAQSRAQGEGSSSQSD